MNWEQRKTNGNFRSTRMTFKCMPSEGYMNARHSLGLWVNRSCCHICEGGFPLWKLHSGRTTGFPEQALWTIPYIVTRHPTSLSGWEGMFPAHVSGALLHAAEDISFVQWAREGSGGRRSDQTDLWKLRVHCQGVCHILNLKFMILSHLLHLYYNIQICMCVCSCQYRKSRMNLNWKTLVRLDYNYNHYIICVQNYLQH